MRITRLQKPLSFRKGVGGEALGAHRCTKKQFGAPANDLQVSRLRPKGALSALFFVVHLKDESLQGRDATCHRPCHPLLLVGAVDVLDDGGGGAY